MTEIKGYHAHVYYNAATRRIAEGLRETLIGRFAVKPGGFSDEPRGPHPISQFNVIFETGEFPKIVPWLMLNRTGLTVLVHPNTSRPRSDHLLHSLWLGEVLPILHPEELAESNDPASRIVPNTTVAP